jgi:hypothetical protein
MKQLGDDLGELSAGAEPPPGFRERVLAAASAQAAPAPRPTSLYQFLRAGAVAIPVGALLFALLFSPFRPAANAPRVAASAPAEQLTAGAPHMEAQDYDEVWTDGESQKLARARVPQAGADSGFPGAATRLGPPDAVGGSPMGGMFGGGMENSHTRVVTSARAVTQEDIRKYAHGQETEEVKRKVAFHGSLTVRLARNVERVQEEVAGRVQKDGGYIEEAVLSAPAQGERAVRMSLRVPVDKLDATVAWLSRLGEVAEKEVRGTDVTEQWVEERSELRTLRQRETRLAEELRSANSENLKAGLRAQLQETRRRIGAAEEQFASTGKLAALATLQVTLREMPEARAAGTIVPFVQNTWRGAVAAFFVAIRVPMALLIWLLIFAPLWVPCAFLYRWASRMAREVKYARAAAQTEG